MRSGLVCRRWREPSSSLSRWLGKVPAQGLAIARALLGLAQGVHRNLEVGRLDADSASSATNMAIISASTAGAAKPNTSAPT